MYLSDTIILITAIMLIVYVIGYLIDRKTGYVYAIGGILPFVGWEVIQLPNGNLLRGLFIAWLWKGICLRGTEYEPIDKDDT